MNKKREGERLFDTVMYVASLTQSAFRFAQGKDPFNFEDTAIAEFLMARNMPFFQNGDVDYKEAHTAFLQQMFSYGWKQGEEDFQNRIHPDLISWEDLPKESREMYGYVAATVCAAKDFYNSLKRDLEDDIMNSFKPMNMLGAKTLCQCRYNH